MGGIKPPVASKLVAVPCVLEGPGGGANCGRSFPSQFGSACSPSLPNSKWFASTKNYVVCCS